MCSVGRLPIRFTVGTGGTISDAALLVRSTEDRTLLLTCLLGQPLFLLLHRLVELHVSFAQDIRVHLLDFAIVG